MNRLKDHTCYLCGPMDHAPDNGKGWRLEIIPKLRKLGIGILNPCDKPMRGYDEGIEYKKLLNNLKAEGKIEEMRNHIRDIVGSDLRMVHKSDFVILYIDKDIFMCGSFIEAAWAMQQRKPLLVVCKQGKLNTPYFLMGMVPDVHLFNNFDELMTYIKHIDQDDCIAHLRRWHFFDYDKVYG